MSHRYLASRSSCLSFRSLPSFLSHDRPRIKFSHVFLLLVLNFLLLSTALLGDLFISASSAFAASHPHSPPATMTFQQFLKQGQHDHAYHGSFIRPHTPPPPPKSLHSHTPTYSQLPPSAEPPKMKPFTITLTSPFLIGGASVQPVDLVGSDNRLEVQIPAGSFDFSHATVANGASPKGTLSLKLTQIHGHYAISVGLLGAYQMQILDSSGQVVTGIRLKIPVTFIYHYQVGELLGLDLDPDHLFLTWPDLIAAAQQAKQPTTGMIIALHNDPRKHTLTGRTSVLGVQPFDMGGGDPQNQSPSTPHFASVQGNAGQVNYSYPLQVPPGPSKIAPQLSLEYSSSDPNQRHSNTSPANNMGDGWSLSLGSISADIYPTSPNPTTWYFISGVANVSDRLVVDTTHSGFYNTEHTSRLRIQQIMYGSPSRPCFYVWDTSGTYYEFGCTADSLQYRNDANGIHYYRWDVDKIVAPSDGPNATYKMITFYYLQDCVPVAYPCPSTSTVRDSALKQILYGYSSSTASIGTVTGKVDFFYRAPAVPPGQSYWVTAYGNNYNGCTPPPGAPNPTTLRCDDPLTYNGPPVVPPPAVMSTLSLQAVTSSVVDSGSVVHPAYGYNLAYHDTPFSNTCQDPYMLYTEDCAGEHLLTSITPSVYQNGTAHTLKQVVFTYTQKYDTYSDQLNKVQNGSKQYSVQTGWQYLSTYMDTNNGVGGQITYASAYNNTHGTPYKTDGNNNIIDDRHDPVYCFSYPSDCTGNYSFPDDHVWSTQVVTQIASLGKDSSATQLHPGVTNYYYNLATTGAYDGNQYKYCYPAGTSPYRPGQADCVSDSWLVNGDSDWLDYYHGEYRGFNVVYTVSPANNLKVDSYYSTEGWNTSEADGANYNGGHLYQEDIYSGNVAIDAALLRRTVNTYTGTSTKYPNSCLYVAGAVYFSCEVMVVSSRTTQYEGTGSGNANAPWVQHDNTYDDYNGSNITSGYHNLTQESISSSNAPQLTRKWTYTPTDSGYSATGWIFYNVDKVTSSEVDDATGHVWKCQDITYDEGAPSGAPSGTPGAGWPTTIKTYSDCTNKSGSAITYYSGYDVYGNLVASVDGLGTANSNLYSTYGCTLTRPAIFTASGNWNTGHYTTCTTYDPYQAQVSTATNALGQQSHVTYDYTQGAFPTSASDINSLTTSTSYSYDTNSSTNGKVTGNIKQPGESGSYTTQSSINSTCTASSTLPCFEVDSNTSQYATAITRTFYDSMGREVETRTMSADASLDLVTFTVYDDAHNSSFESVSFEVQGTLNNGGWVDPNGAVDYQGVAPGGTMTFYDALGRQMGIQDPLYGSSQEPGITCSGLQGTWTACSFYGLGSAHGDAATYFYAAVLDPNNHGAVSFSDELGRSLYTQLYSGKGISSISSNITLQKTMQYNVLDEPTSVTTTDLVPQTGQGITTTTASNSYDDLGRLVTASDPDRGNHTYTYDADGHMLTDVSGTRTLGYNYDLLGRTGCVQDAAPIINATGVCTSGTHPLIQNTYDTTILGTQGSTDFSVGKLTQSVATTYFPNGSQATVTQQMQHDQRERVINEHLQLTLPSSWNVTTALPTYQIAMSYNDADQLTTTTTSTNPSGQGYTSTQVYDTTTGMLKGLSNTTTPTADLATVTYNARGLEDTLNFQTASGSPLAQEQFTYDANLRPINSAATWQSGSGSSGTIFNQSRTYDPASNVTSVSTTQAAVPGQNGSGGSDTENYCYDEQDHLVWAGNSGTQPAAGNGTCGTGTLANSLSGAGYSSSFVYTHLGQQWQAPLNGSSTQYQYLYCDSTHPHQLTGVYTTGTTCATKSDANKVYTSSYDNWGNVTNRFYSGTTATLSYDAFDRLTKWNAGSTSQEWYVYDASGNRIVRRSTNSSGTTLTIYAFGVEEHTYNSTGTNQSNQYYYALSGRLIGELTSTGTTTFFLTDALGSVLSSFNAIANTAAINGNQGYGPYGNQLYHQGSMGTSRGFTGQYNDALTGLDYYNARYYDPTIGRFLSADTVEGNLQGMDPYTYVGGNPETLSDPTGHCAGWWDFGCEAQQAWNATNQEAQTVWNEGIVKPWHETEQAFQTSWNEGFVKPWNATVHAAQQVEQAVVRPIVKVVVRIIIWAVVTVGLGALIGGAAKIRGRPDGKIAQKIYDKTRPQWKEKRNSDDSWNYGGGHLQIFGPGKNGASLNGNGDFSYDDKNSPFLSQGDPHTEKQVVQWAKDIIKQYRAQLAKGGTIKLLIFTRKPPCDICQAALQSEWKDILRSAAGNSNVNVEITVWFAGSKPGSVEQWTPTS